MAKVVYEKPRMGTHGLARSHRTKHGVAAGGPWRGMAEQGSQQEGVAAGWCIVWHGMARHGMLESRVKPHTATDGSEADHEQFAFKLDVLGVRWCMRTEIQQAVGQSWRLLFCIKQGASCRVPQAT